MISFCGFVRSAALGVSLSVAMSGAALAGPILGATSAVINSGGPGFGSIDDTFNQNGLATNYVSGVTDFDTYIAGDPQHTFVFAGNEWFSNSGTNSAQVTYDLGSIFDIDALALWNEEASGIGLLDLYVSTDGVAFSPLALGLLPTDHATTVTSYSADVFSFGATSARFIRFDMSLCPQPQNSFQACAIGEVAFRGADQTNQVPEPGTLGLLGLGLVAMGFGAYRRRKAA